MVPHVVLPLTGHAQLEDHVVPVGEEADVPDVGEVVVVGEDVLVAVVGVVGVVLQGQNSIHLKMPRNPNFKMRHVQSASIARTQGFLDTFPPSWNVYI